MNTSDDFRSDFSSWCLFLECTGVNCQQLLVIKTVKKQNKAKNTNWSKSKTPKASAFLRSGLRRTAVKWTGSWYWNVTMTREVEGSEVKLRPPQEDGVLESEENIVVDFAEWGHSWVRFLFPGDLWVWRGVFLCWSWATPTNEEVRILNNYGNKSTWSVMSHSCFCLGVNLSNKTCKEYAIKI